MDKEKHEMPRKIPVIKLDRSKESSDWIKEMRTPEDVEMREKIKKEMEQQKEDLRFKDRG